MRISYLISTSVLALCLAAPQLAAAQDTEAEAEATSGGGGGLDNIVVTARKTEESIQTTPVAVTALTSEGLVKAQITNVSDLSKAAPSLWTGSGGNGGPGVLWVAIRGQANANAGSGTDSAIATYVDGVYYARSTSGNFGFLDLAQAEVLRGPQGTLFGRNTTGGALNLTTTQPDGEPGGYVLADYGNFGATKFEGAGTFPLQGDELSVRVAGSYSKREGYFDNLTLGQDASDLDKAVSSRVTARWQPGNGPFDLTVSADTTVWNDNGQSTVLLKVNKTLQPLGPTFPSIGGFFAAAGLNPDDYTYKLGASFGQTFGQPHTPYDFINTLQDKGNTGGVAATAKYDFGTWQVKSISAWRFNDATNAFDLDGTPLDIVGFQGNYRQDQYSEELTASAQFGQLDVIGGLYFFKEESTENVISQNFGFLDPNRASGSTAAELESKSTGAFIQANYSFTDRLRGTVGYRHTWDDRSVIRRTLTNVAVPTSCEPPIPLTPSGCFLPLSAEFDYPAWTVGLDYQWSDDIFLYVKSSRASMAGGFNLRAAPPGLEGFQPEEATDAEVGAKMDLLDNRLRANVAIFHSQTKGVQRLVNGLLNGRLTQWNQNTGDVDSTGLELEATALLWNGFEASVGYAYLDTAYVSGSFIENRGTVAAPILVDRSGEVVPNAPEQSFNFGLTQSFDLSSGTLSIHADYIYSDDQPVLITTATPGSSAAVLAATEESNRLGTIPSHSVVNGRVAMNFNNGIEVSVWGRNLTDEEYFTTVNNFYSSVGIAAATPGAPLTYGFGIKKTF